MSINLSNAAVQQFDDLVKHEYQAKGRLRKCVTIRTGVTGDTYQFTRMGQGIANQKATQASVTPMNVEHSRQPCILERWLAPEYTDIFDNDEVNFSEMEELAQTIAKALGRREDQTIIDAMNAGTYSTTPTGADQGLDIATGAAGLTIAKLREINERFQDLEIDNSEKYIAVTAKGIADLLDDPEVTSSDYNRNAIGGLLTGEIGQYMGLNFITLGTRTEGGLPVVTDQRAFAWHKASVGYAVGNIDMMTKVDWVPQKTSWLTNGMLRSGSVIRENAGIIRVNYTT